MESTDVIASTPFSVTHCPVHDRQSSLPGEQWPDRCYTATHDAGLESS